MRKVIEKYDLWNFEYQREVIDKWQLQNIFLENNREIIQKYGYRDFEYNRVIEKYDHRDFFDIIEKV